MVKIRPAAAPAHATDGRTVFVSQHDNLIADADRLMYKTVHLILVGNKQLGQGDSNDENNNNNDNDDGDDDDDINIGNDNDDDDDDDRN